MAVTAWLRTAAVVSVVAGRIFPSQGDLHIAPFNDEALYMEQSSKAHFW